MARVHLLILDDWELENPDADQQRILEGVQKFVYDPYGLRWKEGATYGKDSKQRENGSWRAEVGV